MSVYTLTDEDRDWLKRLDEDLWAKEHLETPEIRHKITMTARRPLSPGELERVAGIVSGSTLLTSMFCTGMFGGYGMDVFEHEPVPDIGPIRLLRLVEGHMPEPDAAKLASGDLGHTRQAPGVGRDDAWEFFSTFTHSERNIGWLKSYGMRPPQPRHSYDY